MVAIGESKGWPAVARLQPSTRSPLAVEPGESLWFGVLGPLEVRRNGEPFLLRSRTERRLLTMLVGHCNRPVTAAQLVDAVWGSNPPVSAERALRAHVSRLRHRLDPDHPPSTPSTVLVTSPAGHELRADRQAIDAVLFADLADAGRKALAAGAPELAAARLRRALGLWRGEAYQELRGVDVAPGEHERLAELRLAAVEDLIEAELALGASDGLVGQLRQLVAENPLRERLWGELVVALYESGRRTDALAACRAARDKLAAEGGIGPGSQLHALEAAALAQRGSLLPPRARPPDLPAPLAIDVHPLLGRDRELHVLEQAWRRSLGGSGHGIVVVEGAHGTGSSRLVAEFARRVQARGAAVVFNQTARDVGKGWIVDRPLLVVVDDPDGPVSASVRHDPPALATTVPAPPLLVVRTARPGWAAGSSAAADVVRLGPLGPGEVAAIVAGYLPELEAGAATDAVLASSHGLPALVHEHAARWAAGGLRQRPGGTGPATVTLLFTDIEGSTRLVQTYREHYAEILADHKRLLRESFAAARGQEVDTQGDSFFVAFPSARDAVGAAVAAQRALAAHRWPASAQVRVRMGIHTAELPGGVERYIGLGVHRAARICSAGHGGQILLSEATYALVADEPPAGSSLRDLGTHRLKDLERDERIWQVAPDDLAAEARPLRTSQPATPEADGSTGERTLPGWLDVAPPTAFVGRAREQWALDEAWSAATAGRRVLVTVSGEPGIGKTTLAARLATRVHASGGLVLYGRWDEEVLAPYQAFREALGEYARGCSPAVLRSQLGEYGAEISRLFPDVARRVGALEEPLSGQGEAERLRLFEALDGWIRALATRAPVLLVLDDLQWADRPSLLLVQHVMRAPRATPLLVVATYRSTDLDRSDLPAFLPGLSRDADARRVPVSGLSGWETVELLGRVTGHELDVPEVLLARELAQETSGNPFFLREIMRHLADVGALGPADDQPPAPSRQIPDSVRDVVSWRLRRLSSDCPDALAVASVIGQEFDVDLLAVASGISEDRVLDLLEEADAAGLVHEGRDTGSRYVFSHAVVRRALSDGLSRARRTRIHLRIAQALRARPTAMPAELAYHYWAGASAAVAEQAVRYGRDAGDRAVAQAAYESAVLHYGRALEVLDRYGARDPVLRAELLLTLGDAHDRAGEYADRDQRFVEAAQAAGEIGDPELFARAALGYGGMLPAAVTPDPQARSLLEEALGRLGDGDSASRARVLGRLSHWIHFERPYPVRQALSNASVAMARRVGDLPTLGAVLFHRCWALDGPRDVGDRLTVAAEVVRLGEQLGNHEIVLQGLRISLAALFERGSFAAARRVGEGFAELSSTLRHPEHLRLAAMWEVVLAGTEGRYQEAEQLADELRVRLSQVGHPQTGSVHLVLTLVWRCLQGRADELQPLLEGLATRTPHPLSGEAFLAWCAAELGQRDRVRHVLDAVTPAAVASMDENYLWWGTVVGFAHAAAALADRSWAQVLYDLALPFDGYNCTLGLASFLGAVSHHLGVLAGVLGRWEEATAHLDAALERHREMAAPAFVALTQEAYAAVLSDRGSPGDAERAAELRIAALRLAAELGLKAIEARGARGLRYA